MDTHECNDNTARFIYNTKHRRKLVPLIQTTSGLPFNEKSPDPEQSRRNVPHLGRNKIRQTLADSIVNSDLR